MREQDNGASLHQCDVYGVYGYGYGCLGVVMCLNSQPYLSMSLWQSSDLWKAVYLVQKCHAMSNIRISFPFFYTFSFLNIYSVFRISFSHQLGIVDSFFSVLFSSSLFSFLLSNGLFTVHCACHIYITCVYISCGLWIIGKQRTCERIMIATWNIKCMCKGMNKK